MYLYINIENTSLAAIVKVKKKSERASYGVMNKTSDRAEVGTVVVIKVAVLCRSVCVINGPW